MKWLDRTHSCWIHHRRVGTLAAWFSRHIPRGCSVLDVGCGDGRLTESIAEMRPDLSLSGIDVLVRPDAKVPVEEFDGNNIPHGTGSVDWVMLVDVLHHTSDPMVLLKESRRVAKHGLIIKDHTADGCLAIPTLRFMDRVGNLRHGVALPFKYWPLRRWQAAFSELSLEAVVWERKLLLYPLPARWLFERSLHFAACLRLLPR